jgi:hypothetical protein
MRTRVPIWQYFILAMIVAAAGAIYLAMPDHESSRVSSTELATAAQVQLAVASLTDGDACSRIIREANLRALENGIVILKRDLADLPGGLAQCRAASKGQVRG